MKHTIEVIRHRYNMKQGDAAVLIDGKGVFCFNDIIEMTKDGGSYYGENIGGWASVLSDEDFIFNAIFHNQEEPDYYRDRVKAAFNGNLK